MNKKCMLPIYIKLHGISLFTTLLFTFSFSQGPDIEWIRYYGYPEYDYGRAVVQTPDGGYVVVGSTTRFDGFDKAYILKTDANGDSLWARNIGTTEICSANSIELTIDGGFIIGGTSRTTSGDNDFYLVKTDNNGFIEWYRLYGGTDSEGGYAAQLTSDSGYIMIGYTSSFGQGLPMGNVYIVKTNASGDTIWTKTYGGVEPDVGCSIRQTFDGGYIIAGYTSSFGSGQTDVWLLRTDSQGDTLWTKTYGRRNYDFAADVDLAPDGGYIVAGTYAPPAGGPQDMWLIKTDANGAEDWSQQFGGDDYDRALSVQSLPDSGYVVAGWSASFGPSAEHSMYVVRTDANGDTLWTKLIGTVQPEEAWSIRQTADTGYIIAGWYFYFPIRYEIVLVKLGPDPVVVKESDGTLTRTQNERIFEIVSGNLSTGSLKLVCHVKVHSRLEITVRDVCGRLINTLADDVYSVGDHAFVWDTKAAPAGVYFIDAKHRGVSQVEKVHFLK